MNTQTTQTTNEMAANFDAETKKAFKSCKYAYMNHEGDYITQLWGDFSAQKDAREALFMWQLSLGKFGFKPTLTRQGKLYRAVIAR